MESLTNSQSPARGGSELQRVVSPVLIALGLMWMLELVDLILPFDLDQFGIRSRTAIGLPGVVIAPWLHGGFGHLMSNTIPFLVLGVLVSWRSRNFWAVMLSVSIGGGFGVWLLGPGGTVTVGASIVVFGFIGYLLSAGIMTRHWLDITISVIVLMVYGGLLLGTLPFGVPPGVSWLGHLCGFIAGIVAAAVLTERSRQAQ